MKRISEYFALQFPHIHFQGIEEYIIRDFMQHKYLDGLSFQVQMSYLADYIISQDLTEVSL
jgi:hypothetical protein